MRDPLNHGKADAPKRPQSVVASIPLKEIANGTQHIRDIYAAYGGAAGMTLNEWLKTEQELKSRAAEQRK
jgi:hypothetical protein